MQREGQNPKGKKANREMKKPNWESDGKGKGFKTVVTNYGFDRFKKIQNRSW